jgi:hypothetical protein
MRWRTKKTGVSNAALALVSANDVDSVASAAASAWSGWRHLLAAAA